jgi:hypothetical protein
VSLCCFRGCDLCSFDSYELRRALTVPSSPVAGASGNGGRNPNVIEHLLPLLREIPLWVLCGKAAVAYASAPQSAAVASPSPDMPPPTCPRASLVQQFDRNLRDKLAVAIRYIENSFCDTSLMFYDTAQSDPPADPKEILFGVAPPKVDGVAVGLEAQLSSTRLSEAEIDHLTANDVEIR